MTAKFIEEQYRQAYRVTDVKSLNRLYRLRDESYPVAWDTETSSLHMGTPNVLMENGVVVSEQLYPVVFGISIAFIIASKHMEMLVTDGVMDENCTGLCMLWTRRSSSLFRTVCRVLKDQQDKVWHNAKFDLKVCELNGIEVGGRQDCTLTMSRILNDRRRSHGLKKIVEYLCPQLSQWNDPVERELTRLKNKYTRMITKKELEWYPNIDFANYSFVDEEIMAEYAADDSFHCLMAWLVMSGKATWR